MIYDVTIYGSFTVTVEAESEEEASELANDESFDWDSWYPTGERGIWPAHIPGKQEAA